MSENTRYEGHVAPSGAQPRSLSLDTQAVWAGEEESLVQGATQVPVVYSAAYGYPDVDAWLDVAHGRTPGHIYSRDSNPTVHAFEEKIRQLEEADAATSFATGMAAVSCVLFGLLSPGDRVVSVKDSYGGTNRIFLDFLPRFGIGVELCDTTDHEQIEAAVSRGCSVLYLETPTNPTLKVVDIARLAAAGHAVGATVVVDNTFATPVNQSPLALGADIVLHSATKYLGGHADVLGGVVCGPADLVQKVHHYRQIVGSSLDPMVAYLLIRSVKTLALRIGRQNESALRIARWLEEQPVVSVVNYPGLPSHPGHEIAVRQMRGYGGMLSFGLEGGFEAVKRVLPRLKLAHRAANLGAVETVAGPPATTSHVECTPEERAAMGIPEGLIRYSVGIEDTDDLIADLEQALAVA
ncbi:MAG TPA: cystathionine gamma-synthase family protein [Thermoleophilia bacterium]|nr:cystathionine gamma-synthase family protein [Thermoleophilia bacterium]